MNSHILKHSRDKGHNHVWDKEVSEQKFVKF